MFKCSNDILPRRGTEWYGQTCYVRQSRRGDRLSQGEANNWFSDSLPFLTYQWVVPGALCEYFDLQPWPDLHQAIYSSAVHTHLRISEVTEGMLRHGRVHHTLLPYDLLHRRLHVLSRRALLGLHGAERTLVREPSWITRMSSWVALVPRVRHES